MSIPWHWNLYFLINARVERVLNFKIVPQAKDDSVKSRDPHEKFNDIIKEQKLEEAVEAIQAETKREKFSKMKRQILIFCSYIFIKILARGNVDNGSFMQ